MPTSEVSLPARPDSSRRLMVGLFAFLFVVGTFLRGLAAFNTLGMHQADEHQQYLEQANRLVYGYSQLFWEQLRGVRNLVYPTLLAGLIEVLEAVGVHDPLTQASLLRLIIAVSVLSLLTVLAWRLYLAGRPVAAVSFLALACLTPDMIYINIRLLSENIMMVPLLLGMLCLPRRPALAGVCWGWMFALRFQSAFLILAWLALSGFDDLRRARTTHWPLGRWSSVRQAVTCTLMVFLLVGVYDRVTLGGWFHSPIEYFRATLLEDMSTCFGVDPWYRHVHWAAAALSQVSVVALPLLIVGACRDRRCAVVALVFLVGHSCIAHKEFRFLWGMMPLVLLLLASGIETLARWQPLSRWQAAVILSVAVTFAIGIDLRLRELKWKWNTEPFRSTAHALTWTGQQPDLKGVAIFDVIPEYAGNYFYLRRNVPLVGQSKADVGALAAHPAVAAGLVNYVIMRPEDLPRFAGWELQKVGWFGQFVVCRIGTVPHARNARE